MINTKFWSDTYISGVDPLEKLLFLYFITNQYTNICGIYEIPLKQIALDTGIDRDNLEKVFLPRLAEAEKIYYFDGWVYIKNFLKHQKASGNVKLGIDNGLQEVPSEIMAKIKQIDQHTPLCPKHKVDTAYNLNSNLNSNLNLNNLPKGNIEDKQLNQDIKSVMDIFYKINPTLNWGNKTYRKSIEALFKAYGVEQTLNLAAAAVSNQGKDYCPGITNPYKLKEKATDLIIFLGKQKNKSNLTIAQ